LNGININCNFGYERKEDYDEDAQYDEKVDDADDDKFDNMVENSVFDGRKEDYYYEKVDDADDDKFKNILFNIIELVESSTDVDYAALFTTYFNLLKTPSESNMHRVKSAIRFIIDQSRDMRRCNELLTAEKIADLAQMLAGDSYDNDMKEYLLEIIYNYSEHEISAGLNECQLKNLIRNVFDSKSSSEKLKINAFLTIMLTVEKTQTLSVSVREILVEKFAHTNWANYCLLILCRAHKSNDNLKTVRYDCSF
jgi:hypothetical protein